MCKSNVGAVARHSVKDGWFRVKGTKFTLACFEAMVTKDRLYHRAGATLALGARDVDHR